MAGTGWSADKEGRRQRTPTSFCLIGWRYQLPVTTSLVIS